MGGRTVEHKEKITAKEGRVAHLPEKAPVDASGQGSSPFVEKC